MPRILLTVIFLMFNFSFCTTLNHVEVVSDQTLLFDAGNIDSNMLGTLTKGDILIHVEDKGIWSGVKLFTDETRYVLKDSIKETSPAFDILKDESTLIRLHEELKKQLKAIESKGNDPLDKDLKLLAYFQKKTLPVAVFHEILKRVPMLEKQREEMGVAFSITNIGLRVELNVNKKPTTEQIKKAARYIWENRDKNYKNLKIYFYLPETKKAYGFAHFTPKKLISYKTIPGALKKTKWAR